MIGTIATYVPSLYWIILSGFLLTVGDIFARFFLVDNQKQSLFWAAFGVYVAGIWCLMMSFFGRDIAVASVMTVLVNATILMMINAWYFQEPLSLMGYIGMSCAFISIIILEVYA